MRGGNGTLICLADRRHLILGRCVVELLSSIHDGHEQLGVGDRVALADDHVRDRELQWCRISSELTSDDTRALTRYSPLLSSPSSTLNASLTRPLQPFAHASRSPWPENRSG